MKIKKVLTYVVLMTMSIGMMTGCSVSTEEQKSSSGEAENTATEAADESEQQTTGETEDESAKTTTVSSSKTEAVETEPDPTLVEKIAEEASTYVGNGDLSVYNDVDWTSIADTFPSKFDLRDRGVVPEIRSQGCWGNCWSFASIAACEISQLSTLGETTEEFLASNGFEMDLSERHLAWFGTGHLPALDEYADGEYPYDEKQAGEGTWSVKEETDLNHAHFDGGYLGYASSVFANGVGPETESDWPYTANDGSASTASDWSIPEDARYKMDAEMLNSSILLSPVAEDDNGDYFYNEAGTEAIKQELLNGRGVSIQYHSDQNMDPATGYRVKYDLYLAEGYPEELADIFAGLQAHSLAPEDMTLEQKQIMMTFYLQAKGASEEEITEEAVNKAIEEEFDSYADRFVNPLEDEDNQVTAEEDIAKAREQMEKVGLDYDEMEKLQELQKEANQGVYMNPETYAQYVDNEYATVDHGVTIVGWDDDYPVSNFLPDHQPPAPGAWICRNSWGSNYGDNGYFYLSYYDRTISFAETFEFIFDQNSQSGVGIDSYDNMEASAVSSVETETPLYMANVFPIDEECVLSYISVMTADLNATVTANVYLLNANYTSPTDGILLETVTDNFEFAGYHRISLNYDYQLPAGSVISVVVRQRADTEDGVHFTLPFTNSTSKEYAEITGNDRWSVGIINEGESFLRSGDQWYDWKDVVNKVKDSDSVAALAEFDNLNIKAYLYRSEGVEKAHDFGEPESYGNGEALICKDCGETMIIVEKK